VKNLRENQYLSVYLELQNIFSNSECQKITSLTKSSSFESWIKERIFFIAQKINQQYFQFSLSEKLELELLKLTTASNTHWRNDLGEDCSPERKISLIFFLSAKNHYQGGRIIFSLNDSIQDIVQEQGSVVVFPSFRQYKFTQIKSGINHLLLARVKGKPFS